MVTEAVAFFCLPVNQKNQQQESKELSGDGGLGKEHACATCMNVVIQPEGVHGGRGRGGHERRCGIE